jgi:hypothetical protein
MLANVKKSLEFRDDSEITSLPVQKMPSMHAHAELLFHLKQKGHCLEVWCYLLCRGGQATKLTE